MATDLRERVAPSIGVNRVTVTGATGFIGQALIPELVRRGIETRAITRPTSNTSQLKTLGVKTCTCDITHAESLAEALGDSQLVFHLAGSIVARGRKEFYLANANGTAQLCRAVMRMATPPVVVIVSSLAAAGPSQPGRSRSEEMPPQPVSIYGKSKLAGEQAAERMSSELPITIVRPGIVFGPSDKTTLPMFRSIYRYGVHLVPGFRQRRFSLIHVADLVRLLLLSAEHGERVGPDTAVTGQGIYFAGCGDDPSYAELGRRIGQALGRKKTRIVHAGPLITWGAAGVCQMLNWLTNKRLPFNWDKAREALAGSWTCSIKKAQCQLGFNPSASLDEHLARTATWYKEHHWV